MLQILKKINYLLPPWAVLPLKYLPEKIIFGLGYKEECKNLSFKDNIVSINLFEILNYARQHTVYGRENIPRDFSQEEAVDVLKGLPKISSSDLSRNLQYFISDEFSSVNSYLTTTGGTGRQPTAVRLSNATYGIEWAHMFDIWSHGGYKRRQNLKLTLRGFHFPSGQLYRFNPIYNEIMVDSFQLWNSDFSKFMQEIKRYNISCIHGYPSLIKIFIDRLKSYSIDFPVSMVFLGSEGVSIEMKKHIAVFFHAKVLSWYGQTEKVILAADFDASDNFACYSSYGFADISTPDDNGFGEIIGTTFINKAMPLINYRTGDYGKILVKDGIRYLTDIHGRWGKDFIYLNGEVSIPTSAVNLHTKVQEKILFYQIIQDDYAVLTVHILPKKKFIDNVAELTKIEKEINNDLSERLKGFTLKISCVKNDSDIIRSSRGKQIMLVQNIKR